MKVYFPPKPTLITLTQPLFRELELREDCVCELKYNGNRLILKRFAIDYRYEWRNRDGALMKFSPNSELLDQCDKIRWEGDDVLDGELLHFKKKQTKNWTVIFDCYLWDGLPMTGFTFRVRRELLEKIFKDTRMSVDESHLQLAPQWKGGTKGCFRAVYEEAIKRDEIEGLVIKSLDAKVTLGRSESPVVSYMFKVRKPGPTYRF
jgi:ATP-dependent DNA ligase